MASERNKAEEDKFIEELKAMGMPFINFSRRPAATIAEASDPDTVYDVKSLHEAVEELQRRTAAATLTK